MASSRSNRYLLQSEDTIHLGVYYLLKFAAKASYNKWMFLNNELVEIIEENEDKNTLTVLLMNEHLEIKNIEIKSSRHKAVELKEENEQRIIKMIKNVDPNEWNLDISFFFGANYYATDDINYSMRTINKISHLTHSAVNIKVSEHTQYLSDCIKNDHIAKKPIITNNNAISGNDWKQIEDHLANKQYNDALDILTLNEHTNDYYKDVYIVYCLMEQYKLMSDMKKKKQTFAQMIKYLAHLTVIMEPCDNLICSIFADILINYNPNRRESDNAFISNMVIASCLCIFEDLNVFNIFGSLTAYKLLMDDNGIIIDQHLENNEKIKQIAFKNVNKLFHAFDTNTHIHDESQYHNEKIKELKTLWNEKMSSFNLESEIKSVSLAPDEDDNIKSFECSICGKAFSNHYSRAAHYGHCLKKQKIGKNQTVIVKARSFSNKNVKKENRFSEIKYSDLTKKEQTHFLSRQKRKRDPTKIGVVYKCLSCGHLGDHKGNMVQHQNRMHTPKNKKTAKKDKKKQKDEIYEPNDESQRIMTRKRKRQKSLIVNDGLNEPKHKKQRLQLDHLDILKCDDCGFGAKNKTGLSVHQRLKKHGKYSCDPPMIRLNDDENKVWQCEECVYSSDKLKSLKIHQIKIKHGKYYRQKVGKGKRKRSDKEENDSENETDQSVSMDDDDSVEILD